MPKALLAVFALALLAIVLKPAPARADSWTAPEPADFLSANGLFRLHVEPGPNDFGAIDPETTAEVKATPKGGAKSAVATLAKKGADGVFVDVWKTELANPVAPVDALVADDGSAVVTFDDWGAVGTGPNAVVIYDAGGKKVAALKLEDFLTGEELDTIPKTVSSLMWYEAPHELDPAAGRLVLKTVVREVRIDLKTGKPVTPEKK